LLVAEARGEAGARDDAGEEPEGAAIGEGRQETMCICFFLSQSLAAAGGSRQNVSKGRVWGHGLLFYPMLEL
jgi:hypothetical protein